MLDIKFVHPIIRRHRDKRLEKLCKDERKANDNLEDHTRMSRYIYLQDFVKLLKLFLLIIVFAYFIGMYWFIMIKYVGNTLFPLFEGE